jgi:hypothetical protein
MFFALESLSIHTLRLAALLRKNIYACLTMCVFFILEMASSRFNCNHFFIAAGDMEVNRNTVLGMRLATTRNGVRRIVCYCGELATPSPVESLVCGSFPRKCQFNMTWSVGESLLNLCSTMKRNCIALPYCAIVARLCTFIKRDEVLDRITIAPSPTSACSSDIRDFLKPTSQLRLITLLELNAVYVATDPSRLLREIVDSYPCTDVDMINCVVRSAALPEVDFSAPQYPINPYL